MNRQRKRGISCHITAFHVTDPPADGVTGPHEWMAIATAHFYDANPDTGGVLNGEQAILAGAVMRVIEGRATASTEEAALGAALRALLYQLSAEQKMQPGDF